MTRIKHHLAQFKAATADTMNMASSLYSRTSSEVQGTTNRLYWAAASAAMLAAPNAHAADAIEKGLSALVDMMTSKYAVGAGTIGIAYCGYQLMFGKGDKTKFATVFIGLCVVFGASGIAAYAKP